MLLLNLMLIFGSITIFLMIAGLALREKANNRPGYLLILLNLSLSAGILMQLPYEWGGSASLRHTARFFNLPSIGLIWWFLLSILDDNFKLNRVAWAGMALTLIPATIFWLEDMGIDSFLFPGINYLNPIVFSVLLVHILWTGLAGLKEDLIADRRKIRIWLATFLTLATTLSVIVGYTLEGHTQYLLRWLIIFTTAIILLFWVTRFQTSVLEFEISAPKAPLALNPKFSVPYKKLIDLMEKEKIYLEPELSITGLAERLDLPAHQLRYLINQGLNYRNFNAFLASYRIADAKRCLTDLEQASTPIMTIALNSGFASLTTFNRTFKNEVGQTAGDYRQVALNHNQSIIKE